MKAFVGGEVGEKEGIYSLVYPLPSLFSLHFLGICGFPAGSQPEGGFAPLLRAPWRVLSVSDSAWPSPALFIYLLKLPTTRTLWAGFLLVPLSHQWLCPTASWAAPTFEHPWAGDSGEGPLSVGLCPWVRLTAERGAPGEGGWGGAGHCWQFPWQKPCWGLGASPSIRCWWAVSPPSGDPDFSECSPDPRCLCLPEWAVLSSLANPFALSKSGPGCLAPAVKLSSLPRTPLSFGFPRLSLALPFQL